MRTIFNKKDFLVEALKRHFIDKEIKKGNLVKSLNEDDNEHLNDLFYRLEDVRNSILQGRASGRTSQRMCELAKKFYDEPVGTKIEIIDHYGTHNANKMLQKKIEIYLETFMPQLKYHFYRSNDNRTFLVRDSETMPEKLLKEKSDLESQISNLLKL